MPDKKVSKPVKHYVRPQAAWNQMKAAQNTGQTVYIYGATGAGKTTFVGDFLSKKQYQYLSMSDIDAVHLADMTPSETNTAHEKPYMKKIIVIDDLYLLETQEDRTICERLIE